MLIAKALVNIFKGVSGNADAIISGFRLTMKLDDKGYVTQLFSEDGTDIPLAKDTPVIMYILYGEVEMKKIMQGVGIEFISGRIVGEGYIYEVKEIYVEKEAIEKIPDIQIRREIVNIAENIDNAIIYEDVYTVI